MAKETVYSDPLRIKRALQCDHRYSPDCPHCPDSSKAKGELVVLMSGFLHGIALRHAIRHHVDAEDLVNLASAKILAEFHRYKPHLGQLLTYFGTVAGRVISDYCNRDSVVSLPPAWSKKETTATYGYRAKSVQSLEGRTSADEQGLYRDFDSRSMVFDHREGLPEDAIDADDAKTLVRCAIKGLERRLRVTIEMRMAGRSLAEVGDYLGVTREAARQIEIRGRKRMKEIIETGQWRLYQ